MTDPTPAEVVDAAIDALLEVVARSADDLRAFHATVAKARLDSLPPFPRTAVATTERIVQNLQRVETEMKEMLQALGLAEPQG
ncbi:MAG: hypothetical protein ABI868_04325 [Acidobacteriota bacterium]